jgi:hypothetical protein
MTIHINDFKTAFGGGTRQNRFVVTGNFPYGEVQGGGPSSVSKFHIRATQMPALSTLTMEYNYFGRKGYYPGEKQYPAWSVAVIDDTPELYDMWKKFSYWHNQINQHSNNISDSFKNYKADSWTVQQLNLNGEIDPSLKTFEMFGVWPRAIMDVNLNMATPNTLNQFTVVLVFDYIKLYSGAYNAGNRLTAEP